VPHGTSPTALSPVSRSFRPFSVDARFILFILRNRNANIDDVDLTQSWRQARPPRACSIISTIESRAAPTLTRYSFTREIQFLRPVSQRSYFRQSDSYHYCCRLVRKVLPQKRAMRGQVSRCFE